LCFQFAAQGHPHFSAQPGRAFLGRLFRHNPSDTYDTSPSSSFDWARNLLKWRGRTDEGIKLHGRSQAVVEVPCAPGQRVCSFSFIVLLHLNFTEKCLRKGTAEASQIALKEYYPGQFTAFQAQDRRDSDPAMFATTGS